MVEGEGEQVGMEREAGRMLGGTGNRVKGGRGQVRPAGDRERRGGRRRRCKRRRLQTRGRVLVVGLQLLLQVVSQLLVAMMLQGRVLSTGKGKGEGEGGGRGRLRRVKRQGTGSRMGGEGTRWVRRLPLRRRRAAVDDHLRRRERTAQYRATIHLCRVFRTVVIGR